MSTDHAKRYDVFLSHSKSDKPAVEQLAAKLQDAGLRPFLDEWHLVPGESWQDALAQALAESSTCAVFFGPREVGPWEHKEMRAALQRQAQNADFRVIPVFLPGAPERKLESMPFLEGLTWVEFGPDLTDEQALHRFICGIQGKTPGAPLERRQAGRPRLGEAARPALSRKVMVRVLGLILLLAMILTTVFLWKKGSRPEAADREKASVALGVAFGLLGQTSDAVGPTVLEVALQRLGFPPLQIRELAAEYGELEAAMRRGELTGDHWQAEKTELVAKVKGQLQVLVGGESERLVDFGHDLTLLQRCLRSWHRLGSEPEALGLARDYLTVLRRSAGAARLPGDLALEIATLKESELRQPTYRRRAIETLADILHYYGQE